VAAVQQVSQRRHLPKKKKRMVTIQNAAEELLQAEADSLQEDAAPLFLREVTNPQ
jgi:hypothetical protein